jgi:hypothetical protein
MGAMICKHSYYETPAGKLICVHCHKPKRKWTRRDPTCAICGDHAALRYRGISLCRPHTTSWTREALSYPGTFPTDEEIGERFSAWLARTRWASMRFRTTAEQRAKVASIAATMVGAGLDAEWVGRAAEIARIDQGVFELLEIWDRPGVMSDLRASVHDWVVL